MTQPTLEYPGGASRMPEGRRASAVARVLLMAGLALAALAALATGTIGPLGAILLLLAVVLLLRTLRHRRGVAVLGYLEQAVRMNQPLPEMLGAAAMGERSWLRVRLESLRDAILDGASIGQALERCVPEMPVRQARLIGVGEATGQLPRVLRELLMRDRQVYRETGERWVFVRFYPLMLLLTAGIVVAIIFAFVMPKLQRIFQSFHMEPGPWSRLLASLGTWGPLVLLVLAGVAWVYLLLKVWEIFRPRERMTVWRRPLDVLRWYLPLLRQAERSRELGDALGVVAGAMMSGFTLEAGVLQAGRLDANAVLQARLLAWYQGLNSGLSPADAAQQAGLPRLVVGMLRTPGGGMADSLRFLEIHYRDRFSRTVAVLKAAVIPATTLVMGSLVLLVALGVYEPMTRLAYTIMQIKVSP